MAYKPPIWVDYLRRGNDPRNAYIHYAHTSESAQLVPIQFGWHNTSSAYGYGPTIRDHYLIHFIHSGAGNVVVGNRQYAVREGQCFAIYPHQITYYEADVDTPWTYFWLGFEGDWSADMMSGIGFSDTQIVVDIPQPEQVFGLFDDLLEHLSADDFYLYLTGRLHTILYHLRQRTEDTPPQNYDEVTAPMGNEYVRILLSIITTSFSERISVTALAERLGLNRSYMTELFRKHTGRSIKSYLHEYRLQWSLLLLQNPSASIKSVALESGFLDPLYFSRAFRARFGLSPQQYRDTEAWRKTNT